MVKGGNDSFNPVIQTSLGLTSSNRQILGEFGDLLKALSI